MAEAPTSPDQIAGFAVEIGGITVDGWTSINIPASSTEPESGNGEDTWGETTFQDLEMERWLGTEDTMLYDWREAIADDNSDDGLKEVVITAIGQDGSGAIKWTFEDAWIKYYEPPQLDISDDGIVTERISLGYDSMERETL